RHPGDRRRRRRPAPPDRRRGAGRLRAGRRPARRPGPPDRGTARPLPPGAVRLQATGRHQRGRDAALRPDRQGPPGRRPPPGGAHQAAAPSDRPSLNHFQRRTPMNPQWLDLPARPPKPRAAGLTMVIDNGLPTGWFADAVASSAQFIDIVKFGWGTCMVTEDLDRKISVLADHGIRFCFGGTLFEKFVVQDRFDAFLKFCHHWKADIVEVSNGTISMSNAEKAEYIRRCAAEFAVSSEVGFKDQAKADLMTSAQWVDCIAEDLAAGASLVITEARESGKSGICRPDGHLRGGLVETILAGGADPDRLLFEAPTKDLQTQFITLLGPNVNLGNVSLGDVIALETLRLGLRGDTLLHFEAASIYA